MSNRNPKVVRALTELMLPLELEAQGDARLGTPTSAVVDALAEFDLWLPPALAFQVADLRSSFMSDARSLILADGNRLPVVELGLRLHLGEQAYEVSALTPVVPEWEIPGRPAWPNLCIVGRPFLELAGGNGLVRAALEEQRRQWQRIEYKPSAEFLALLARVPEERIAAAAAHHGWSWDDRTKALVREGLFAVCAGAAGNGLWLLFTELVKLIEQWVRGG
mgnify:CR=1 FL=1